MQIALDGPAKYKRIPTYEIEQWRLARADANAIVCRPGLRTVGRRLAGTLVAAIIVGGLYYTVGGLHEPRFRSSPQRQVRIDRDLRKLQSMTQEAEKGLRDMLSEDEWQQFQAQRDAERAQRQAVNDQQRCRLEQLTAGAQTVCYALMGIIGFLGVLAPVSCLWNRLTIYKNPRGDLAVSHWGFLFPSSKHWPVNAFREIAIDAQEVIVRTRYYRNQEGWRYRIRLVPAGTPAEAARFGLTELGVEFRPYRQKQRPTGRPPEPVARFLKALQAITGLPYGQPTVSEYSAIDRWSGRYRTLTPDGAPAARHTYHSLDEMPPELRGQAEQTLHEAGIPADGASGSTRRVYRSLDEMPPDIRARAEAMMAQARESGQAGPFEIRRETITVTGPDGVARTYHSVDEMPPDLRARYEQIHRTRGS